METLQSVSHRRGGRSFFQLPNRIPNAALNAGQNNEIPARECKEHQRNVPLPRLDQIMLPFYIQFVATRCLAGTPNNTRHVSPPPVSHAHCARTEIFTRLRGDPGCNHGRAPRLLRGAVVKHVFATLPVIPGVALRRRNMTMKEIAFVCICSHVVTFCLCYCRWTQYSIPSNHLDPWSPPNHPILASLPERLGEWTKQIKP